MRDLDTIIRDKVHRVLEETDDLDSVPPEYAASDSLGEVVEKLIILHIRMWHLEDAIQAAKTNDEIADLKRKIDICFKVKRPKLVAALNAIVDDAIVHNKSLREDSVKLYKGIA
jgi:predicted small metal-binding protein